MLPGLSVRSALALAAALTPLALFLASPVGGGRSDYDDSQLIAFTRADGIYVIRADGRGERPLRRGGVAAGAGGLAWSPDGRRLAFTTGGSEIWAMDAHGNGLARVVGADQISARAFASSLSWSPLGRRIAFIAFGARDPDVWVVGADGTNAHRLLRTPNRSELQVDWSPYGDRIAVADARGYFFHLYLMDTRGRHVRAVNPGWFFQAAMPRWSPNGQRIAFMGWPGSEFSGTSPSVRDAEILVLDVNLRYPRWLTRNAVVDSDPSWSSDGSKIVFVRGRGEQMLWVSPEKRSRGELYVMNDDGTGVRRLTHNRVGEGSPAWQPVAVS